MRKIFFYIFICLFLTTFITAVEAEQKTLTAWQLPLNLSDQNTTMKYRYSTSIGGDGSGKSAGVSGRIWLKSLADIRSVKAEMTIPVPMSIFTGDSFGAMNNFLSQSELPPIKISIEKITNLCDPHLIRPGSPCRARMEGRAAFGTFSKYISLPVRIERTADAFEILGEGDVDTAGAASSVPAAQIIDSASVRFLIRIPEAE